MARRSRSRKRAVCSLERAGICFNYYSISRERLLPPRGYKWSPRSPRPVKHWRRDSSCDSWHLEPFVDSLCPTSLIELHRVTFCRSFRIPRSLASLPSCTAFFHGPLGGIGPSKLPGDGRTDWPTDVDRSTFDNMPRELCFKPQRSLS